jgi:hypothetical protein
MAEFDELDGGEGAGFVWRSTDASVRAERLSAMAFVEVVVAASIVLCGFFYAWQYAKTYPWISIIVAPLLLLRSNRSVALGLKWFEYYVDGGWGQDPQKVAKSAIAWLGLMVVFAAVTFAVASLTYAFRVDQSAWFTAILGIALAYLALQICVATYAAVLAHQVAALIVWMLPSAIASLTFVAAVAVGLIIGGASIISFVSTFGAILLALLLILREIPAAVAVMRRIPRTTNKALLIDVMQEILQAAPISLTLLAPGVFLGGWLRTLAIRFGATLRYLPDGFRELPSNWRRTLFVIDYGHPPEVIPGYIKSDLIQVSFLWDAIKRSKRPSEFILYCLAYVLIFGPALFYRFTIKSTFWFYLPLVYVMRPSRFAENPALFVDLVWSRWLEWVRFFWAAVVLIIFSSNQIWVAHLRGDLPPAAVSMLEYVFVFDLSLIRPWQWFNLISSSITIAIFAVVETLRTVLKHAEQHTYLQTFIIHRVYLLDRAKRTRSLSTYIFLSIAFAHVLLWTAPQHLPPYVITLLQQAFQ